MKNREDVENYLIKKGWEYKEEGDEFLVNPCPICGKEGRNEGKFSINGKMGLWQTFCCQERGNLYSLKERLGDSKDVSKVAEVFGDVTYDVVPLEEIERDHQALLADLSSKQWLYGRGLGDDAIERFKLGVSYTQEGRFIAIPYFKDGICVNVKYRSLPPLEKSFKIKPKHEKPLFNCDCLEGHREAIVVEGEIDCITAIMMGFPNVVSLPMGADNFDSSHWDTLVKMEKIYLVLDPDGAGRTGMKKLATRLGEERCYNVKIPNGWDPNDLLVKFGYIDGKARLEACIHDAKPVGKGEVAGVRGALLELFEHITSTGTIEAGFTSPWPSVNRVIGHITPGEVILLQAIPKTGKTTFALQWLAWLAECYKIPSMMYCLEMPLWRLAQTLVAQSQCCDRREISPLHIQMTQFKYRDSPLYYGSVPKEWSFAHIKEIITYSVRRYGVQLICFDNLQLLSRSTSEPWNEQAMISRGFKELAMDLNVGILLVVQPKKMDPRSSPGMYSPSGSASILADCDGMITLWRKPLHADDEQITDDDLQTIEQESFGPETLVRCPASRYRPGGQAQLYFRGDIGLFAEIQKD